MRRGVAVGEGGIVVVLGGVVGERFIVVGEWAVVVVVGGGRGKVRSVWREKRKRKKKRGIRERELCIRRAVKLRRKG